MGSPDLEALSVFLKEDVREDLKTAALQEVLGLTGSRDGCLLIENHEIRNLLIDNLSHHCEIICQTACLSLVNVSSTESGANSLLNCQGKNKQMIVKLLELILDQECKTADAACMLLSNLTRNNKNACEVSDLILHTEITAESLINIFTKKQYNCRGCSLNYLGSLFLNLSQGLEFRRYIMQPDTCLVKKLLPFINFHESAIRKSGVIGTIKNCCFETDYHEWLLGPDVDVLPCLLLPLAGPEEFDEEDTEKLPFELQYLGENKKRESDADIRKMLLEALLQLCATKLGREFFRSKNVYVILREYHKWEENKSVLLVCENIINLLIRTEEEINESNLKELEVPKEYIEHFEKMDDLYCQDK